jgi:hypothetical protein
VQVEKRAFFSVTQGMRLKKQLSIEHERFHCSLIVESIEAARKNLLFENVIKAVLNQYR